jgi:two-component system OmpR family response regulator
MLYLDYNKKMKPVTTLSESRILVVDDDREIRDLIVRQLQKESYIVTAASGIAAARASLVRDLADVVVLDLALGDGDGLALCRELRAEGFMNAIIMVTARDTGIDRVLGLELGADDYLTKPFEPRELIVRIRNLLRRRGSAPGPQRRGARVACFGPWRLDLLQRRLITSDNRLVILSAAEYRLLSRFIEAPDQILAREALLPERRETVAFDRSIDLQISRLRQKLAAESGGEALILTVRSEGYIFATEVTYE